MNEKCLVSRADPFVFHTAASNREIGAMLGEMSGFAVAKAYQRIVKEMETESTLREKVKRLEREMSCVKG